MAINKVKYGNQTLIDLTDTTATADKILTGFGAYGKDGVWMDGTASTGSGAVADTITQLPNGGDHHNVYGVDLTLDTVAANKMLSGTTAHDSAGNAITGNIATKTSSDLTASGATVTVPAGYYASARSKSVSTIGHPDPSVGINTATGVVTASHTQTAGYVSAGTTTKTLSLPVKSTATITPGTSNQTISAGQYLIGTQTISGDEHLTAGNIKKDVEIFGITGTYEGSGGGGSTLVAKTVTPSTITQVVTPEDYEYKHYEHTDTAGTVFSVPTADMPFPAIMEVSGTGTVYNGDNVVATFTINTNTVEAFQSDINGQELSFTVSPNNAISKIYITYANYVPQRKIKFQTGTSINKAVIDLRVSLLQDDKIGYGEKSDGMTTESFDCDFTSLSVGDEVLAKARLYYVDGGIGTGGTDIDHTFAWTGSTYNIPIPSGSSWINSITVNPSTSKTTISATESLYYSMTLFKVKTAPDGLSQVTVNAIPSEYIIPSGNITITENVSNLDVSQYATATVTAGSVTIQPLDVTSNGTYAAPTGYAYSPVTVSVGEEPSSIENKVCFYDYDGTLLHEYTERQFSALSSLPRNPSHTGLISQGWNWTKQEITTQLNDVGGVVNVGQLYATVSDATEIDIELIDSNYLTPYLAIAPNGTVSIDWGDNSAAETITGSSTTTNTYQSHAYAQIGNYTIKITAVDGTFNFYKGNSENTTASILRTTDAEDNRKWSYAYSDRINAIRFGSGVAISSQYALNELSNLEYVTMPSDFSYNALCKFSNCYSLYCLIIPRTYLAIPRDFARTTYNLTIVSIPPTVTSISSSVFNGSRNLKDITIPYQVTTLDSYAFNYCTAIETLSIPPRIGVINSSAFSYCTALKEVHFANNSSTSQIGSYAFNYCYALERINIPNTVTSIYARAFEYCYSLKQITIPTRVRTIGANAFNYCYALSGTITLPAGITSIEGGAFSYCNCLEEIVIPSGVTSIGRSSFAGCRKLKNLTLPEGITSIGNNAFSNCGSITDLTLPSTLTSLGTSVANGCTALKTAVIPSRITTIPSSTFNGCSALESVTISGSITSIGASAFTNCNNLKNMTIPSTVTEIGNGAFSYCQSLEQITIPNSVRSLGTGVFQYCYRLRSVTISNNSALTKIPRNTFGTCKSLKSISMPNNITAIDNYAFSNCNALTEIILPNSLTTIGQYAFQYVRSCSTITIPSTVTGIAYQCFSNSFGFDEYHLLPSTPPTLGANAFNGILATTKIYVPAASLTDYQTASNWSTYASYMVGE